MKQGLIAAASMLALSIGPAIAADLKADIAADYPYIEEIYKDLHANPELSLQESRSSGIIADELRKLGFQVTTNVGSEWTKAKAKERAGKVLPGVDGYGVVAVMENGDGPTVLIRADMDALPLEEKTGLPYASKVVSTDYMGQEAPVMHACGHDIHMSNLIGTARQMVDKKDQWSGTLVLVAQPAEEIVLGALAMFDDGLYERFPRPDYALAMHVSGGAPAGTIAFTPEYAMAAVDSVDIYVKGVGGHGAYPHNAKDPIVIGAQIVTALQTLVSREVDPIDSGVVTVGSFQAGYKHNIIPDEAHLQITVRSYTDEVRETLRTGIKRIAEAQARSAGLPDDMMPVVKYDQDPVIATYNDPALVARAVEVMRAEIGAENVVESSPVMGGEDFAYFGKQDPTVPAFLFWVGAADPKAFKAHQEGKGPAPASIHSPNFAPAAAPTLQTGIRTMTATAIDLFGSPASDGE